MTLGGLTPPTKNTCAVLTKLLHRTSVAVGTASLRGNAANGRFWGKSGQGPHAKVSRRLALPLDGLAQGPRTRAVRREAGEGF